MFFTSARERDDSERERDRERFLEIGEARPLYEDLMDLDEDLLDDDGMDDMFNADLGERDFPLLDPLVRSSQAFLDLTKQH